MIPFSTNVKLIFDTERFISILDRPEGATVATDYKLITIAKTFTSEDTARLLLSITEYVISVCKRYDIYIGRIQTRIFSTSFNAVFGYADSDVIEITSLYEHLLKSKGITDLRYTVWMPKTNNKVV